MKIAYIVLCHKNANQINLMIENLLKNNSDVFLHIDLKSDIEEKINKREHLYILPKSQSYSIDWGSNNMILATLNLLKFVRNTNNDYDYICLLSGQDFPIVNYKRINETFEQNKGYNFIDIIDKDTLEYKKYKKLYEIWYPKWITKNNVLIKIIKRIYMIVTGGFYHTFSIFKRKKPFDFEFEFGSQWWALTSKCAYNILDYCEKNKEYIEYFNHCIIPDESFFQTLFMSSPYVKLRKDNLTFVNWGKNRRSPEILNENDYEKILKASEKKCFARKFDESLDRNILMRINEMLKEE